MKELNKAIYEANGALHKNGSNFRFIWSGVTNHDGQEYSESDYFIIWASNIDLPDLARLWMKAPYSKVVRELQSVVEFPDSVKFGYTKFHTSNEVIPDPALQEYLSKKKRLTLDFKQYFT